MSSIFLSCAVAIYRTHAQKTTRDYSRVCQHTLPLVAISSDSKKIHGENYLQCHYYVRTEKITGIMASIRRQSVQLDLNNRRFINVPVASKSKCVLSK